MYKFMFLAFSYVLSTLSITMAQDDWHDIPPPFQNAKVGQWAEYLIGGKVTTRAEIVEIDDKGNVTVRLESWRGNDHMATTTEVYTVEQIAEARSLFIREEYLVSIEHKTCTVLGKEIPVTVATESTGTEYTIEKIVSSEIPLFGEVRIHSSNSLHPLSELIGYGE